MNRAPLNISFKRTLVEDKMTAWNNLVAKISAYQLSDGRDIFTWDLHRHDNFTVRSMYQYLMNQETPFVNKFLWKLKIPLKINFFLWYLQQGVILTKDNLAKRNWSGSKKCCFCDHNEIIQHLFYDWQHAKIIWRVVQVATGLTPPKSMTHMFRNWLTCISMKQRRLIFVGAAALIWAIWCTRNDLIFEKKIFSSFMRAVFRGAYWLRFWSQL